MPQCMERDRRQFLRGPDPAPISAQIVRREQLTFDGGEDRGCGLDGASANSKAQLHLLQPMAPQRGDGAFAEADATPASLRLWRLQPETGSGLFDGSLDAKRVPVEIHITPLKAAKLTAPHAGGESKLDNWQQDVLGELGAKLAGEEGN